MEYYQRIKNIREDLDIKQYQFAKMLDILPKTYNLYENGRRCMPSEVINKILKEFNLSLDYILGLTERKSYPYLTDINFDVIPSNLRKFRKKKGMNQTQMSILLNCNQQTLSEYERGRIKIPWQTLKQFCKIIGVSSDTITGRTNKVILLKENTALEV